MSRRDQDEGEVDFPDLSLQGFGARSLPTGCVFCGGPVDQDGDDTYHEVTSWVSGPKLQSPKLRTQTGRLAHGECVQKLIAGQAPDQESLGLEE